MTEPSFPELLSFEDLQNRMKVGAKLCPQHRPFQLKAPGTEKLTDFWLVCFASFPTLSDSKYFVELSPLWKLLKGVREVPVEVSFELGHKKFVVPPGEEANPYLQAIYDKASESKQHPDLFPILTQRAFVRLDIARFSRYKEDLQPLVIAEVNGIADAFVRSLAKPVVEKTIHTGDGFILAFPHDQMKWAVTAAEALAKALDVRNDTADTKIHFRISITAGSVYLTKDLEGGLNYVGTGITEAERVISCMPANVDDLVYCDDNIFRGCREYRHGRFHRLGSHPDKHGEHHRIYSLDYDT